MSHGRVLPDRAAVGVARVRASGSVERIPASTLPLRPDVTLLLDEAAARGGDGPAG